MSSDAQDTSPNKAYPAFEVSPVNSAISLTRPARRAEKEGVVRFFQWRGESGYVSGEVVRGASGLAVQRIEVSGALPAGITHGLLRAFPLGDVLKAARLSLAADDSSAPQLPEVGATSLPPGRVPITDDLLRKVAMAYIEETAPDKGRQATKRLADRFNRPEGTVRTWIARARTDGWLAPGTSGRMGAEPGVKLTRWLGQAMDAATDLMAEFTATAQAYGATTAGVPRAAIRSHNKASEMDFPLNIGTPPIDTFVVAQILYGQPLSAEMAERVAAGQDEDAAFDDIAGEVRRFIADHQ